MNENDDEMILQTIGRWTGHEVRPIAMAHDHEDEYPDDLVGQMKEPGLFGATIGLDYGGLACQPLPAAQLSKRLPSAGWRRVKCEAALRLSNPTLERICRASVRRRTMHGITTR